MMASEASDATHNVRYGGLLRQGLGLFDVSKASRECFDEDGLKHALGRSIWRVPVEPAEQEQAPSDYGEQSERVGERANRTQLPGFEGASSLDRLEEFFDQPP